MKILVELWSAQLRYHNTSGNTDLLKIKRLIFFFLVIRLTWEVGFWVSFGYLIIWMNVTHLRTFLTLILLSPTCSHLLFCRGVIFGCVGVKTKIWSGTIQTLLSLREETVLSGRRSCLNNQSHTEWISQILPLPVILPCSLLTRHESKLIFMLGGAVSLVFMNTMNWTFIYPKLTHPCYPSL